jgi:PhnB protein
MKVQPYLYFDGKCEEALKFYEKVLGAKVVMQMRFKESPSPSNPEMCPPGSDDKIMHVTFKIGDTEIMASDGENKGRPVFQGISLSVSVPTEAEADRIFGQLAESGHVQMPLTKTFFSPKFGMVADRFGVSWMVIVGQ